MKKLKLFVVLLSSMIFLAACAANVDNVPVADDAVVEDNADIQDETQDETTTTDESETTDSEVKEEEKEEIKEETKEETKGDSTMDMNENITTEDTIILNGVATMDDGTTNAVITDDNKCELTFDENGTLFVDGKEYALTFEDNFDGDKLDTTKWSNCPEWKRQDQNCYWSDDCITVKDGKLVVASKIEDGNYYMGAIRSKGKFEQAKGYFETRCTLNTVPGYWVAFWLMGDRVNNVDGSGKDGTEIDIMESAYFGKGINHALHWDGYGKDHKSLGHRTENKDVFDGEYHTFSVLWTDNEYVFYIDRKEVWRTEAKEAKGVCMSPLYMKFTSETSSWTSRDRDDSKFPTEVYVDYVKVWAKQN